MEVMEANTMKKVELIDIPLSKLVTDKANPRKLVEEAEEMADSLAGGQEVPCKVEDLEDGHYLITDGHRRYAGFQVLAKRTKTDPVVKCIVEHKLTPTERLLKRIVIENQQKNWSVPERDIAWKTLWTELKISKTDFAKKIGANSTALANFFDRQELGDELTGLDIGSDVVSETKGLPEDRRKKLLKMASDKGLGCREVRQLKKIIKDTKSESVVDALTSGDLTSEQADKIKDLPDEMAASAIHITKTQKKSLESVYKEIDRPAFKKKTETDIKAMNAGQFVTILMDHILDTANQMAAIEGTLKQINDEELDQYFTPKMKEVLSQCLTDLQTNIKPATDRITSQIKRWK
jgi:ParB-like chromosome segregation protein Spo0J